MIRLLYSEHLYPAPSTERQRITKTTIIGPSGSTTKVGAALLLWVWTTAHE